MRLIRAIRASLAQWMKPHPGVCYLWKFYDAAITSFLLQVFDN
jgi:hypothetical protein